MVSKEMGNLCQTLAGKKDGAPPVWLMRQAGRYLPEYRELRQTQASFLEACYTPKVATEITLQPMRRFDLDAAIIFSDILVIPHAMGQDVSFVRGEGPQLGPLQVPRLKYDPQALASVYEAVELARLAIGAEKDLIGFCGAPWTLACYMVEGRGSKAHDGVRHFALSRPQEMEALMELLVDALSTHLVAQAKAGASVLQIFESWGGACPYGGLEPFVFGPTKQIVDRVRLACPGVPIIGFPRGMGEHLVDYVKKTGVNAVGLDYTMNPEAVNQRLGKGVPVQGAVDPQALVVGGEILRQEVQRYKKAFKGRPHIMNLGHGVVPNTPPKHVEAFISYVREAS